MDKDKFLYMMIDNAKAMKLPAKTITDLSYYTKEDITAIYEMSPHTKESTKAYKFFMNLFDTYGANMITLGNIIPQEYIIDPIKMLDGMLIYTHIREKELISRHISEMANKYNKLLKEVEKEKNLNYNEYIKKRNEIRKKMKELKKRNRKNRKYLSWFR